jgi:hypothetical protein
MNPGSEHITARIIDPRAGSNKVPGIEEGTTLIELLEEEQVDAAGKVSGPSMVFEAAPGARVDEGTTLINDLLDYNLEKPVTVENCPRLYVAASCKNTIYALRTWTGADGEKGATKDPLDCLKMGLKYGLEYVSEQFELARNGRGF